MAARVLIIDTDHSLYESLRLCLTCEQFDPHFCDSTRLAQAFSPPAPIIVVDQRTPLAGAPQVCRQIRQHPQARHALIFLLVPRADEQEAIDLLNGTIDAFMVKPFGLREFVARVRALDRRQARLSTPMPMTMVKTSIDPPPLSAAGLDIDFARRTVRTAERQPQLTEQEFQLLYYLANHPGRVFTREALVGAVWGGRTHVSLRSVDALVKRLRQRLGDRQGSSRYVQTVRGVGYRFVDNVAPASRAPLSERRRIPSLDLHAATHLSPTDH